MINMAADYTINHILNNDLDMAEMQTTAVERQKPKQIFTRCHELSCFCLNCKCLACAKIMKGRKVQGVEENKRHQFLVTQKVSLSELSQKVRTCCPRNHCRPSTTVEYKRNGTFTLQPKRKQFAPEMVAYNMISVYRNRLKTHLKVLKHLGGSQ